jgi:hypothetical protein
MFYIEINYSQCDDRNIANFVNSHLVDSRYGLFVSDAYYRDTNGELHREIDDGPAHYRKRGYDGDNSSETYYIHGQKIFEYDTNDIDGLRSIDVDGNERLGEIDFDYDGHFIQ